MSSEMTIAKSVDWIDIHLFEQPTDELMISATAALTGVPESSVALMVEFNVVSVLDPLDADVEASAYLVSLEDDESGFVCAARIVGPPFDGSMSELTQRFVDAVGIAGVGGPDDIDGAYPGDFDVFIPHETPIRVDLDASELTDTLDMLAVDHAIVLGEQLPETFVDGEIDEDLTSEGELWEEFRLDEHIVISTCNRHVISLLSDTQLVINGREMIGQTVTVAERILGESAVPTSQTKDLDAGVWIEFRAYQQGRIHVVLNHGIVAEVLYLSEA